MKVLFLTHTRLGDAVLSTGVINHYAATFPQARITVVCSPLVAGLFAPMPNVERVIAVRKRSFSRHWWEIWRCVVATRWDEVVDLRNSAVSRLVLAGRRRIWAGGQTASAHKVEQIAGVIGALPPPAPRLWFDQATQEKVTAFLADAPAPRIVLAPVANWPGKTWPAGHFAALIEKLDQASDRPFDRPSFVVVAGPGEEAAAAQVLAACPHGRGLSAIAAFSPVEAACLISHCDAFIGNDSGLMHCAAATGIPTLALFGPTNAKVYGPWGENARVVATPESYEDFINAPEYSPDLTTSLMGSLTPEAVYAAFQAMIRETRR